jgi:hypothetical protein
MASQALSMLDRVRIAFLERMAKEYDVMVDKSHGGKVVGNMDHLFGEILSHRFIGKLRLVAVGEMLSSWEIVFSLDSDGEQVFDRLYLGAEGELYEDSAQKRAFGRWKAEEFRADLANRLSMNLLRSTYLAPAA